MRFQTRQIYTQQFSKTFIKKSKAALFPIKALEAFLAYGGLASGHHGTNQNTNLPKNPKGTRGGPIMEYHLPGLLIQMLFQQNGAVVRALASHRSGLGSIPGPGVTCRLSLLLVLVLPVRVFLWVLWLSSLHKNQHAKFKVAFDACMYEFLTSLASRG